MTFGEPDPGYPLTVPLLQDIRVLMAVTAVAVCALVVLGLCVLYQMYVSLQTTKKSFDDAVAAFNGATRTVGSAHRAIATAASDPLVALASVVKGASAASQTRQKGT